MSSEQISENEFEIHSRLCSLMSREQYGGYDPQQIGEDCWIIINKLKVLIFEYLDETCQSDANMEVLYEHVNENFFTLKQFYEILNPDQFPHIPCFFESVIHPIVEFFVKDWNTLSNAVIVENILEQNKESLSECLCDIETGQMEDCFTNYKFCYRCGQVFHSSCFKMKYCKFYECYFCFLTYCLPDREVKNALFKGYLHPVEKNKSSTFIIDIDWSMMNFSLNDSIEIRCARIDEENSYEINWPEFCDIYLDDIKSVNFRPLPENSSLKKRHDNPVIIPVKDLVCSERIKIEEHYSEISCWHIIGIFVVVSKNQKQIFESIISNQYHQLNENLSNEYLQKLFWKSNCLQIDQLSISNECQYYGERIKYPSRSRLCSNHYQPFDLYSFICSSVQAKSSIKRWKCPICGVRAYDIICDERLEKKFSLVKSISSSCVVEKEDNVEEEGKETDKNVGSKKLRRKKIE